MTDGFDDIPNEGAARARRLQIRSWIRATNNTHPRCAGCGCDMLVFSPHDFITVEQYEAPGWEWIKYSDLRPGDLLCFWCSASIVRIEHQFLWGHA